MLTKVVFICCTVCCLCNLTCAMPSALVDQKVERSIINSLICEQNLKSVLNQAFDNKDDGYITWKTGTSESNAPLKMLLFILAQQLKNVEIEEQCQEMLASFIDNENVTNNASALARQIAKETKWDESKCIFRQIFRILHETVSTPMINQVIIDRTLSNIPARANSTSI